MDHTETRFIDVPALMLSMPEVVPPHGATCFIVDYKWWAENADELEADMLIYGIVRTGMVLFFPDEDTRILWKLRWY